jgi:HAD superfamily hydrolase (TIGR01459 family)
VRALPDVASLAALFEGFILDQWGVMHDGTRPYPGAVDCLRRLRSAGKRIVVLSNTSKREAESLELVAGMGFDTAAIDRFVSAGEEARRQLQESHFLGTRCYAFTRGGDRSLLEGIGLELVNRVEDAEFLAVIGSDAPRRLLADYEDALRAGIARGLPMICANPDTARFTPQGLTEGQGVLARRYETLGGKVFSYGKPDPPIYRTCLAALECARDKVVAIGDSIDHDVLGASRVGVQSALIPGGVHGAELGVAWGELPSDSKWHSFAARIPARPDYLLAAFKWR